MEVERRRHRGDATAADVKQAEEALHDVKMKAAKPWRERLAGIRAAVRDGDNEIAAYVGQHYAELADELGEDAQGAVAAMNDALAAVDRAYLQREAVAARVIALAGVIRRPGPMRSSRRAAKRPHASVSARSSAAARFRPSHPSWSASPRSFRHDRHIHRRPSTRRGVRACCCERSPECLSPRPSLNRRNRTRLASTVA